MNSFTKQKTVTDLENNLRLPKGKAGRGEINKRLELTYTH